MPAPQWNEHRRDPLTRRAEELPLRCYRCLDNLDRTPSRAPDYRVFWVVVTYRLRWTDQHVQGAEYVCAGCITGHPEAVPVEIV